MFKAKLIDDLNHYVLRRKILVFSALPNIFIGILIVFFDIPFFYFSIVLVITALISIFTYRIQKDFSKTFGDRMITIDDKTIQIDGNSPDNNQVFQLHEFDKIYIKEHYDFPEKSAKDILEEVKGNTLENFIILEKGRTKTRFDFVVESHYMLVQLDKIIETWKKEKLHITYIE